MTAALRTPTTTFSAPDDRTATEPPEYRGLARDQVRLLVASPTGIVHTQFRDLPQHLRAGDLLVVNNSGTLPAELDGHWRAGRPVVVHLATDLSDGTWVAELRTAPDARSPILTALPGQVIQLPARVHLHLLMPYPHPDSSPTGSGNRLWRVRIVGAGAVVAYLHRHGRPIAYGYLDRRYGLADYQTVFATRPGSAEMPSAGRPFTQELVGRLTAGGIGVAPITLHTGVSSQDAGEAPQAEWYHVSERTAALVNATRQAGGRVVAVGTTATRALESAAFDTATMGHGSITASEGWTNVVVDPCRGVRVVDGLITGWHNPEASHLLLVEAVAGGQLTQKAYDAAVAEHYRWHEFGDAGLLLSR